MTYNPIQLVWYTVYDFAYDHPLVIGIVCAIIGVVIYAVIQRKFHQPKRIFVVPAILLIVAGLYIILWNFRIIDYPHRNIDDTKAYKLLEENNNRQRAQKITFKVYKFAYIPEYLTSRTQINSVLEVPNTSTNTSDSSTLGQSSKTLQFDVEYHKYLTGIYINSDAISLSESVPIVMDIKLERTRTGCCSLAGYPFDKFELIGKNTEGGDITKASGSIGITYFTDYSGTRLALTHNHLSEAQSSLSDTEAIRLLQSVVPLDINSVNFTDKRV